LEELKLYDLKLESLPVLRYDFSGKLAVFQAAHPDSFPPVDSTRDRAHTRNLVGFLPWTITEYTARLKSAFSYLKAYQTAGGTPDEIANPALLPLRMGGTGKGCRNAGTVCPGCTWA
jgi:hypothetical protein